ncbi:putative HTH-type transcriptional regulator [Sphingomonas sp. DBB INV C78]|uniref:aminotransferase-like domain-containing protein n=1 Tax=Sphingomonas sp. DBB INV C78 TaxID=3349434 RepID=UPI0036D37C0F
MQNWLPDLGAESGPKYRAIADAIGRAIRGGVLRAGERLPPQRDLARLLGVDLTTVTRGYGIAREAGLIEGAGRLGSYVRNSAAPVADGASDDTGMNMPPQPGFGLLDEAIRTGTAALLRAGGRSPLLQYQPSGGNAHDRAQAAEALVARGIATTEDQLAITAGGQNALHAILGTTLSAGDRICTGAHTYPGLLALAARLGIQLSPVEMDAQGMDPAALEQAIAGGAKAIYLVPTNDNPTAATLGIERRHAIAEIARRHGATIIEDDAYGQLPSQPLPSLASLIPERTWHIASTSKVISPVLRVAHLRAPTIGDAWLLARQVHETAVMAPPLNAALVSAWLRDGTFAELVAGVRAEAVARQRIAARHLTGLNYAAHPEGYHIWLKFDGERVTGAELAAGLRSTGLSIVPGEAFSPRKDKAVAAVRISIGGAIDHDRLGRAFERVAALLHGRASGSAWI